MSRFSSLLEEKMNTIRQYLSVIIIFIIIVTPVYAKTPLEVVNMRMKAHNNHDIDGFMETYSDNIQIYDYPDTPIGKPGKEHIRNIFIPLFKNKAVRTEVHRQIVQGKHVVNHETFVSTNQNLSILNLAKN
jgi:hypothetical protein